MAREIRSITIKLAAEDLAALQRIVQRRYPRDSSRLTQTVRDLIREEDARGARDQQGATGNDTVNSSNNPA